MTQAGCGFYDKGCGCVQCMRYSVEQNAQAQGVFKPLEPICICPTHELMAAGCVCGAITRYGEKKEESK